MTIAEKMSAAEPAKKNGHKEWLRAVDALMAEVAEWSQLQGWRIVSHDKQVVDESTQEEYTMPVLDIITEPNYSGLCREVKLVVEPNFFDAARRTSRVDFSVWPTMHQVILIYETNRHTWSIKGDLRFNWPSSWSQESFISIAGGLLEMGR